MTEMSGESKFEKGMFWFGIVPALVLLFVVLSQPAWRGEEMIAELRSDCDKVGGVMLEHKKMFGTSYECAERLDR
jgi:hypothetical protein